MVFFKIHGIYLCENKNCENPKTEIYSLLASQLVLSAII